MQPSKLWLIFSTAAVEESGFCCRSLAQRSRRPLFLLCAVQGTQFLSQSLPCEYCGRSLVELVVLASNMLNGFSGGSLERSRKRAFDEL